jgi:sugar lactone lactonase YvrE
MSTSVIIECIAATSDICGEGAIWHAEHHAIYWTDINRRLIHRCSLPSRSVETWKFDQPVTALTHTTHPDTLLVVLGGSILLWSPIRGQCDRVLYKLPEWPLVRCNDARVDPAGVLWFGTMQNNITSNNSTNPVTAYVGDLISLHSDGELRHWQSEIGIANTLAWTPSGETMLFADTLRNEIYSFDYNIDTQGISNRRIFCAGFERGLPDGSTMDVDGYLWNCRYGGGCIVRFAPDGSIDRVIDVPVANPTTCTFGGEDRRTLYFTSAGEGKHVAGAVDGGLFSMRTESPGLPFTPFRLIA